MGEWYSPPVQHPKSRTAPAVYAPGQALRLLANGLDTEALGVLADRPVIAVSLDGRPEEGELAGIARRLPCVFLGIAHGDAAAEVTAEFDVMLCDRASPPRPWVGFAEGAGSALFDLVDAVERSPHAAVTLAQSLRIEESLPDDDALTVESLAYGLLQAGPEHADWLARRSRWNRPTLSGPVLLVERVDTLMTITLNRPRLRNMYDDATRDALVDALRIAVADESIERVVLRGAGSAFCIGGDIRQFGSLPDPVTAHIVRASRSAARWLVACSPRLTSEVHGYCIGAGIELAAFASRVVATSDTQIRLPELAMGLMPGAGGTVSVMRRIGRCRTAYLALSGRTLDAATALDWGLVDEVGVLPSARAHGNST
jgi:enoyl-CoA hydratase/carnithine racemase